MRKYLNHLRNKPDSHKNAIAWGTSGVITAIIATVWVTSFGYFYGDAEVKAEIAQKNTENSPMKVIQSSVANVLGAFSGSRVIFEKQDSDMNATGTLEYVPE